MTKKEIEKRLEDINKKADECRTALGELRDDQQEYYDSRSERWQESDAGLDLAQRIEEMDTHLEALEELCSVTYGFDV